MIKQLVIKVLFKHFGSQCPIYRSLILVQTNKKYKFLLLNQFNPNKMK